MIEQRKQRENEDEEINELLARAYTDFLKLVIDHPELKLRSARATPDLTEDQQDQVFAMFEILTSLFERVYLLLYEDGLTGRRLRLWLSWEDFMREWCRREDFRVRLPDLLCGEDPDFASLPPPDRRTRRRRNCKAQGEAVTARTRASRRNRLPSVRPAPIRRPHPANPPGDG
jgi:hypothetical protein